MLKLQKLRIPSWCIKAMRQPCDLASEKKRCVFSVADIQAAWKKHSQGKLRCMPGVCQGWFQDSGKASMKERATPNINKRFLVFFVEHLLWIESSESPSLPTRTETYLGLWGSCVLLAWLVLIDWSTVNPSPCVFSLDVVQVVQDLLIGGKASPRVCPNSS